MIDNDMIRVCPRTCTSRKQIAPNPFLFDIVMAMTGGQWDTSVLANLMYDWMFRGGGDFGRGAAIAIVIMLAVLPIMIWNIRQARAEQKEGH